MELNIRQKFNQNCFLNNSGFMLIELIVVVGIILLITAITLPNYRAGERQFALQRSASKLSQDIRRVQEMAMSAKECEPCGGIVPSGYGIHLIQGDRYYLLYADDNPAEGNQQFEGGDEVIETINFEEGIYIDDIRSSSSNFSLVSINFKAPDPTIDISTDTNDIKIIISLESDPTKTKIIKVNKAGLIYVE